MSTDLNADQIEAVAHEGCPLLVVAGPGSGKTKVLSRRIAYRIDTAGIDPRRILGITFTQRAAQELKQRARDECPAAVGLQLGTFHWACHAILRRYASHLGYRSDFQLLSPAEARRVQRTLITGMDLSQGKALPAISAVKNGVSLQDAARRYCLLEHNLAALLTTYQDRLRALGALDLDDLLHQAVRLLENHPDVRERCRERFDEILVDEYQDTNPRQQELLALLLPASGGLTAVGDEDQAIYGWRQATAAGVDQFLRRFDPARVITLRETYRSTKLILRAATELIGKNVRRTPKDFRTANDAGEPPRCFAALDERDEAEWVARQIEQIMARGESRPAEIGVLFRTNAQSRALEEALVQKGIAYRVFAGRRFYEREEVRAVVAFLRLTLDERDEAATAFLLKLVPGIGERRRDALLDGARRGESPFPAFLAGQELPVPSNLQLHVQSLGRAMQSVTAQRQERLAVVADAAIAATTALFDQSPGEDGDFDSLDELRSAIAEAGGTRGTVRAFVDTISLGDVAHEDPEVVYLLSLHAAKGLEFSCLFLTGLEEGLLPHRRSLASVAELEEERRLCYVGMTRARRRLFMSYARSRMLGGQVLSGSRSRFLTDMGRSNMTLETSPLMAMKPRLAGVSVGESVLHPRWQEGTVVQVQGVGRDTVVTVDFASFGRRQLQLCHAPLSLAPADGSRV